jgi:Ca2+-binding EF-hand superfamily protein
MTTQKYTVQVALPAINQELEPVFRENFARLDTDGNGELDKKEFMAFLEITGQTANNKYVFEIVDCDHSGAISFDEFLRFARSLSDIAARGDVRRYLSLVFASCDIGKKGTLTQKEFINFMKYIGHEVGFLSQKKVFKEFDDDGNGTIDLNEILAHIDIQLTK